MVAGALSWPPRLRIGAAASAIGSVALLCGILAIPSFPTTYAVSPVAYSAEAVSAGALSYAEHCRRCHGDDGAGKSGERGTRASAMTDLRDIVPERREGDLFWVIGHGLGSRMPGSGTVLRDTEIWELVQFLDAQVAARNALALSDRLGPVRPVPAPDFVYELAGQPQQALRGRSEKPVTLLVFYTVPDSLRRLREIASREAASAGARIIALPMTGSAAATASDVDGVGMLARPSPVVASTYRMFAGQPPVGNAISTAGSGTASEAGSEAGSKAGSGLGAADAGAAHVEYLIDRFGMLRSRVIGIPPPARADAVVRQVASLASEPSQAAPLWTHRH
jgi:mono/diheme cytochrome c family protein